MEWISYETEWFEVKAGYLNAWPVIRHAAGGPNRSSTQSMVSRNRPVNISSCPRLIRNEILRDDNLRVPTGWNLKTLTAVEEGRQRSL